MLTPTISSSKQSDPINLGHFSTFSQKFLGDCGILQLMGDLGSAVQQPGAIMLGGGNPSHIPEVQAIFRARMQDVLANEREFENLTGNYCSPAGDHQFIEALVDLFRREYGWEIGPENVALTNGSQTAFFFLFNMFGGRFEGGKRKRILLPLAPEYIGYADAGLEDDLFVSARSQIEFLDDHLFKYHIDFDAIGVTEEIGAICVSRPTNPTGNVLTEDEIAQLSTLARDNGIPLIIDNAYGTPFPGVIYTEATPKWEPHVVMCMSLSKLGLPGTRTGIVIAHERIIEAVAGMNAVMSLAPGGFGASLALEMVRSGEIIRISSDVIKPHYAAKAEQAVAWLQAALEGTDFFIHKPEGAFFLWLWFRGLPVNSQELYERLKARNVLIVPGHHFFPGLIDDDWPHRNECLRMSYAGDPQMVHKGVQIIAEEVKQAYAEG